MQRQLLLVGVILVQCFVLLSTSWQLRQARGITDRALRAAEQWQTVAERWKKNSDAFQHAAEDWQRASDRFEAVAHTSVDTAKRFQALCDARSGRRP